MLRVEFDPEVISFSALLERFWAGHHPERRDRGSQYRAILLCETDKQLEIANESAARIESASGAAVGTELVVAPFHRAEAYHQKWKLRQRREVFADLARLYESETELLRSMAATKLNALVAGHLSGAETERFLDRFGLSPAGMAALRSSVPSRLRAGV